MGQDFQKSARDRQKLDNFVNERIDKAIDSKQHQIREVLKEVERNTRSSYQGHMDYHKFLMEEARKKGDVALAIHHQVLMETYEGILKNFSMSNSYELV